MGQRQVVGTALCMALISLSAISVAHAYAPKQDFRGALSFVENNRQDDDVVVTVGLAMLPYEQLYGVGWKKVQTLQDLDSVRRRTKRTWLVYTMPIHLQAYYPKIMANIQSEFQQVKTFGGTLRGGTIFVCRADLPPEWKVLPASE